MTSKGYMFISHVVSHFFQVRIYSIAIPDTDITNTIQRQIYHRDEHEAYLKLHLKMQDENGDGSLRNYVPSPYQATMFGKSKFVNVSMISI